MPLIETVNARFKDPGALEFLKRLLDAFIVMIAAHAAAFLYFDKLLDQLAPIHSVVMYICTGMVFYLFSRFQLYASWRGRSMRMMFVQLILAWGLIVAGGVLLSYLIHLSSQLSRLWMVYWFGTGAVLLLVHRLTIYTALRRMRKQGMNARSVVLVGYGDVGREMHRRALAQGWFGYQIKAIHCNAEERRHITNSKIRHIQELECWHRGGPFIPGTPGT